MSQRPLPVLFVCLLKQGQAESEASVDFLAGRSPVNLGAQASGLCSEKAPFVGPSLPSQVQGLDSSGETPSISKSPWAAPLDGQKCWGTRCPSETAWRLELGEREACSVNLLSPVKCDPCPFPVLGQLVTPSSPVDQTPRLCSYHPELVARPGLSLLLATSPVLLGLPPSLLHCQRVLSPLTSFLPGSPPLPPAGSPPTHHLLASKPICDHEAQIPSMNSHCSWGKAHSLPARQGPS